MDYSFPRYLLAKQSIDDRALNRIVYEALVANLPPQPLRMIEVGAGIGTMLARLLRWGLLEKADYLAVDEMQENTDFALDWFPSWAVQTGLLVDHLGETQLRLSDAKRNVRLTIKQADVFDFIQTHPPKANLLIAHAFLDLLPMPDSLPLLFSLLKPGGLAWLTVNFDGLTTLEPSVDPQLDAQIEHLYHQTMDARPSGGDSHAGRHLFGCLKQAGAEILSAGSSDWVVYPVDGHYSQDEMYFLQFILHFFENSLKGHPDLDPAAFANWLAERRRQVERGELVYIAHQMDFLVQV
jgi:hypothetical protein